jgi:hypothetical protein
MMGTYRNWLLFCLAAVVVTTIGCAAGSSSSAGGSNDAAKTFDPTAVQAANMNFADRYLTAMEEEYDRARRAAKTPEAALMAQRLKILAGNGAMGNAVDPNPVVGLMDMAVMVTLTYQIAQDQWVVEMYGKETADAMVAALKLQQDDVWQVAGRYLTAEQVKQLHQLAAHWRAQHPDQRYVAGARLADFSQSAHNGGETPGEIVGSALNLVKIDPFHGLDPAVKEVAESRILAERMFYYLRHTPILMTWQTDSLFDQMLAQPQVTQLFQNTTTVAGSTTRFSDATSRFSDASEEVAQTVEKFRLQLPDQQAKLVAELESSLNEQQALMTQNLQLLSDQSIDRLYRRGRSLVLITVGSVLLAFILYRQTGRSRRRNA